MTYVETLHCKFYHDSTLQSISTLSHLSSLQILIPSQYADELVECVDCNFPHVTHLDIGEDDSVVLMTAAGRDTLVRIMSRADLTSTSCDTLVRIIRNTARRPAGIELVGTDMVKSSVRRLLAHCIANGMIGALSITGLLLPIPEFSDCFPTDLGDFVSEVLSSILKESAYVKKLNNCDQTLQIPISFPILRPHVLRWVVGAMRTSKSSVDLDNWHTICGALLDVCPYFESAFSTVATRDWILGGMQRSRSDEEFHRWRNILFDLVGRCQDLKAHFSTAATRDLIVERMQVAQSDEQCQNWLGLFFPLLCACPDLIPHFSTAATVDCILGGMQGSESDKEFNRWQTMLFGLLCSCPDAKPYFATAEIRDWILRGMQGSQSDADFARWRLISSVLRSECPGLEEHFSNVDQEFPCR